MTELPAVDGVNHRFVEVDGLRTHVAEAGSGEPVVMLHGWPQNWYAWRRLIPPLAERYRVICPDMRGFGWSAAPAAGYGKEALAMDVGRLLDALELERVRLVGHDWGSILGFLLCVRQPERVDRFLALGGSHLWPRASLRETLAFWRFWYQAAVATPLIGPWLVERTELTRFL